MESNIINPIENQPIKIFSNPIVFHLSFLLYNYLFWYFTVVPFINRLDLK
jgi:hypothetical protein